jgi:hypothetical protein
VLCLIAIAVLFSILMLLAAWPLLPRGWRQRGEKMPELDPIDEHALRRVEARGDARARDWPFVLGLSCFAMLVVLCAIALSGF